MDEIKIAIGEPKWSNDHDRKVGIAFAHKYHSVYKMIRDRVKEVHMDYVKGLVERRHLSANATQVRISEYITRLSYHEIKEFAPMMWEECRKETDGNTVRP